MASQGSRSALAASDRKRPEFVTATERMRRIREGEEEMSELEKAKKARREERARSAAAAVTAKPETTPLHGEKEKSVLSLTARKTHLSRFDNLPWWKRVVLDPVFRKQVCTAVTARIRQHEEEPDSGPLHVIIRSGHWLPRSLLNRVPGTGLLYRWLSQFPPTGFAVTLPETPQPGQPMPKMPKAPIPACGKLTVNVFAASDPESFAHPSVKLASARPYMICLGRDAEKDFPVRRRVGLSGKRSTIPPEFVGALRPSFRLLRWRSVTASIRELQHRCGYPESILKGFPEHDEVDLESYQRHDLTESRIEYLFTSEACRSIMKKIFSHLEKDLNGRATKLSCIVFALDMYHLFMPSFYSQSNIELAEDEWICRGTLDMPDFQWFFWFWFDFPLFVIRAHFVSEEDYCEFWSFVYDQLFVQNNRNRDEYEQHELRVLLSRDPHLQLIPAARRPLYIQRQMESLLIKRKRKEARRQLELAYQDELDAHGEEEGADDLNVFVDGPLNVPERKASLTSASSSAHLPLFDDDLQHKLTAAVLAKVGPEPHRPTPPTVLLQSDAEEFDPEADDDVNELLDYASDVSDQEFEDDRKLVRDQFRQAKKQRMDDFRMRNRKVRKNYEKALSQFEDDLRDWQQQFQDEMNAMMSDRPTQGAATKDSDQGDQLKPLPPRQPPPPLDPLRALTVRKRERDRMNKKPLPRSATTGMFSADRPGSPNHHLPQHTTKATKLPCESAARMHTLLTAVPMKRVDHQLVYGECSPSRPRDVHHDEVTTEANPVDDTASKKEEETHRTNNDDKHEDSVKVVDGSGGVAPRRPSPATSTDSRQPPLEQVSGRQTTSSLRRFIADIQKGGDEPPSGLRIAGNTPDDDTEEDEGCWLPKVSLLSNCRCHQPTPPARTRGVAVWRIGKETKKGTSTGEVTKPHTARGPTTKPTLLQHHRSLKLVNLLSAMDPAKVIHHRYNYARNATLHGRQILPQPEAELPPQFEEEENHQNLVSTGDMMTSTRPHTQGSHERPRLRLVASAAATAERTPRSVPIVSKPRARRPVGTKVEYESV